MIFPVLNHAIPGGGHRVSPREPSEAPELSWVTGRDYFGSAYATAEWTIGNTPYDAGPSPAAGYAPSVGTEKLVDNGSGGLTGQTHTDIITGAGTFTAWEAVDTGDRLEASGATAGDFNALTTDAAGRMEFKFPASVPNSEYIFTKFNTSDGGWRVYTVSGEWIVGLWDNSGNTDGVQANAPASGTYADGEAHYLSWFWDSSTKTMYTKGDLSTEASAVLSAIVDSTETSATLNVNGYAGSTGLAGLECLGVSVCVGAAARDHYDEIFWNHPPS